MSAVHRKRLLKLADFLEKLPRNRFDMARFTSDQLTGHHLNYPPKVEECGTAACALGWATRVFRDWTLEGGIPTLTRGNGWMGPERDAEEFFGLTTNEVSRLFYGPQCSPQKKAKELRKVATS